jgi:5-formyltetrahydrofolate cyclo-ligase
MSTLRLVRQKIWPRLQRVALPDSRFNLRFSEVIPDFAGSDNAVDRIASLPAWRTGAYAFVAPDNSLVSLRRRMIEEGITLVVATYGIARGFILLDPATIPQGHARYAAWLDGLEHFGQPFTLEALAARGRFDLMVTGASAVTTQGVRFGKGHGFFDLEWGMFSDLGIVDESTPVATVVHDVQVVEDALYPSSTDVLVDLIATPTRTIDVRRARPRPRGIAWDTLEPEIIDSIPPLRELQRLRGIA